MGLDEVFGSNFTFFISLVVNPFNTLTKVEGPNGGVFVGFVGFNQSTLNLAFGVHFEHCFVIVGSDSQMGGVTTVDHQMRVQQSTIGYILNEIFKRLFFFSSSCGSAGSKNHGACHQKSDEFLIHKKFLLIKFSDDENFFIRFPRRNSGIKSILSLYLV